MLDIKHLVKTSSYFQLLAQQRHPTHPTLPSCTKSLPLPGPAASHVSLRLTCLHHCYQYFGGCWCDWTEELHGENKQAARQPSPARRGAVGTATSQKPSNPMSHEASRRAPCSSSTRGPPRSVLSFLWSKPTRQTHCRVSISCWPPTGLEGNQSKGRG